MTQGGFPSLGVCRSPAPGFGEADLSNCEREQIHLADSIQPHGALLVVSEPDHVILQASANAAEFLNLRQDVLGCRLSEVRGDLVERIQPLLSTSLQRIPTAVQCHIGECAAPFDGLMHRPPAGGLVIELETPGPAAKMASSIEVSLRTVIECDSLSALCDEAARMFKKLTGYDRVMVYRFDEEGHGEVCAEHRNPDLEPFLGMRYPASDIPQIARALYQRNRIRLLVDVEYKPVPVMPRLSPLTGLQLDMSLCSLRSMSPIHIQYLKNMGVTATLVVSLVVGGRLWGLIACHHYAARWIPYGTRAVCELLAETIATRIAALESFIQGDAELTVRRLEQRMISAIFRDGDWRSAFCDSPKTLLQPLKATGTALLFRHDVVSVGEVPGTAELREVGAWLDQQPCRPVLATASLGIDEPAFAALRSVASGILAVPVSSSPGEYLIWLRPERVRTITWGGDPSKAVVIGDDPSDLSPRRSFAQWHQLVEGTSEPWTRADVAMARLIGETVSSVLLQFRSVRLLIAQDQLDRVRQKVGASELPVAIADAGGRILLTNDAFRQLLQVGSLPVLCLRDLSGCFADLDDARWRLEDLLTDRRSWRAEVRLKAREGEARPVLVTADPVFSSPDRLLGFVVQFTDLRERKAAEDARLRFQSGVLGENRLRSPGVGCESSPLYRKLLYAVFGNAQLAALEITHSADIARIPESLESVRLSVSRTAELLERLLQHASSAAGKDG